MSRTSLTSSKTVRAPAAARLLVVTLVVLLLAATAIVWWNGHAGREPVLRGLVVSPTGEPVPDAEVRTRDGRVTTTDGEGRFSLPGAPTWATVAAKGWIPRTRALGPEDLTLVRLVRDTPGTVTMTFGGDVMFGRRYFDPAEDGSMEGLLRPDDDAAAHVALLEGVAPLLADADMTVVNLETPLSSAPGYDATATRPAEFHATKDYAFASSPAAAKALVDVGVDVVDLGNNHLYDRLENGVTDTVRTLAEAGLSPGTGMFGAGADTDQAWQPALREVDGQTVALLGCTSIVGDEHPESYVASESKGGAARCTPERLRREVRTATTAAQVVVVMIHGGYEYGRDPSAQVRMLSDVAVAAGATLVINHHPHVVGGLRFADETLTAWSLGNLLFDQTVWQTFDSYVLTVAVRRGRVVGAWTEPLRLQNYQPAGVYGHDAEWAASGALPRSEGPWVADDGSLWLDTAGAAVTSTVPAESGADLVRLDRGCAVGAGRELLWTGHFEDLDLQPPTASTTSGEAAPRPAALWNTTTLDPYRRWGAKSGRSGAGVRLHRADRHGEDVLLNPNHRILVGARDRLTFLVDLRAAYGAPKVSVQLSWYNDTRGGSQAQTVAAVPVSSEWRTYRVDVAVPRHAVAVMPYIRLEPPTEGVDQALVDNVRLVNLDEPGCDYLSVAAGDAVSVTELPPVTEATVTTLVDAATLRVDQPAALPPLPEGSAAPEDG